MLATGVRKPGLTQKFCDRDDRYVGDHYMETRLNFCKGKIKYMPSVCST